MAESNGAQPSSSGRLPYPLVAGDFIQQARGRFASSLHRLKVPMHGGGRRLQPALAVLRCLHVGACGRSNQTLQLGRHGRAALSRHSRRPWLRQLLPLCWHLAAGGSRAVRRLLSSHSRAYHASLPQAHRSYGHVLALWSPGPWSPGPWSPRQLEQLQLAQLPEVHLGRLWAYGRDTASEYARAIGRAWEAAGSMKVPEFPWNSVYRIWEETLGWLPCYARSSHMQIGIINSLNTVGNHLPPLLGLMLAESLRSSAQPGAAFADDISYVLEVGEEPAWGRNSSWWRSVLTETQDAVISLARILHLTLLFVPLLLSFPLALYTDYKRAEWIELLRKTLESAGPAFIKWGQWAATRHDLFPPDVCTELELLHASAPAHGIKYTRAAITSAFSMDPAELFDQFDEQPVASGSIGQVHKAVLGHKAAVMTGFKPGTVVAVKVRHPGVGSAILRDFGMMMWVAHVAGCIPALRDLRLEDTLQQFAAPLREQVDLSREAHNLYRFNRNFAKTRHVQFPVPLYPLVSPDVLVETFEDGTSISKYIVQEGSPYNPRLAVLGSAAMLKMMLVDNLIHSDLHPGNILVRLDPPRGLLGLAYRLLDQVKASNTRWGTAPWLPAPGRIHSLQAAWRAPRIVLLDVGMATELSGEDQKNMVGLFSAFAGMDAPAVADWVLSFSGPDQTCPDPATFKQDMIRHFSLLKRDMEQESQGHKPASFHNAADALAQVLELIRQHKVSLPGHICAVVVTTLVLEGWSNKLDPEHSVMTQVQTMFEHGRLPWGDRISRTVDAVMEQQDADVIVGPV